MLAFSLAWFLYCYIIHNLWVSSSFVHEDITRAAGFQGNNSFRPYYIYINIKYAQPIHIDEG